MGNKRQRNGRKKNSSHSSKRQRRCLFVPQKLWAEECLELLPPDADESLMDTSNQLWVKITAHVITNEEVDLRRNDEDERQHAEERYRGPKGAWLHHLPFNTEKSAQQLALNSTEPYGMLSKQKSTPATTTMKNDSTTTAVTDKLIFIQRLVATIPKPPKRYRKHLPNGDCGDGIKNPHEHVADKYWAQRHSLFTKMDEGIQMVDAESWYSVTPELIARHIAARMASATTSNRIILDAFCGIGGNAIAFALQDDVELVVCVDTDLAKLKAAANNSLVYGVPKEKMVFIHGDACDVLQRYERGSLSSHGAIKSDVEEIQTYRLGGLDLLPPRLDSIFLSPPWGGVEYMEHGNRHFNFDCINLSYGMRGKEMLRLALNALKVPDIAVFLPRNLNGLMVAQDCYDLGIRGTMEIERNYVEHKLKTITVYIRK